MKPSDLSTDQLAALEAVANGKHIDATIWAELNAMDLVGVKYGEGLLDVDYLTDLGRRVLASAPDTGSGKPATISAAEFVANDYAGKIARGECEVVGLKTKGGGYYVASIINYSNGKKLANSKSYDEDEGTWVEGAQYATHDSEKFEIEWHTVIPAADNQQSDDIDVKSFLDDEITRLAKQVAVTPAAETPTAGEAGNTVAQAQRMLMYGFCDVLIKAHMWTELYAFRKLLVELYGKGNHE